MIHLPEDDAVRGGVYLCQVGPRVSCGGCCGLYNHSMASSRTALHAVLAERTQAFAAVPRTVEAITAFEQDRLQIEGSARPIASFHHCVFVGLIQDNGERIGCLLHPLALGNKGVDWRGLSFYGGAACKFFFCPSYDQMEARWKQTVRLVLDDWYEYGLIIVEHRLLAAVFSWLETETGRPVQPNALTPSGRQTLADLLRLKITWPFRKPYTPLGWNFFSTKDTARPALQAMGLSPHIAVMLQELDTDPDQLGPAPTLLIQYLDAAAQAF